MTTSTDNRHRESSAVPGIAPADVPAAGATPVRPQAPRSGVAESAKQRGARHRRRARLYLGAFVSVGSIVVLAALVGANREGVEIDWIVGSSRVSLAWIVLLTTVLGWLAGIAMALVFRYRTRAPAAGKSS